MLSQTISNRSCNSPTGFSRRNVNSTVLTAAVHALAAVLQL